MGSHFSKNKDKKKTKKAENKITDQDRAMLDLKNARDKIKIYQRKLNIETEELTKKARQLVKDKKQDRALLVLKLKKYKVTELQRVDGQLFKVEEMIHNAQSQAQYLEALRAIEAGKVALEKLKLEFPLEEVEKLMDESQEAIAYHEEIGRLLAGGDTNQFDEEEMQQELEKYQKEMETPAEYDLPIAPTGTPVIRNEKTPQEEVSEAVESSTENTKKDAILA